jgi:CRP/FNR family transcriptional regulator, cyclic AMP receptor protein
MNDKVERWTPSLAVRREALRGCALFRHLTDAELKAVLARATIRHFRRGQVLMHRGDPATGMVVILRGLVRVSVTSAEGREISLGMLGTGDVVGEMALLDGSERSADVAATEDCVLLTINRSDFLPLLESNASLCLRLLSVLCARLRDANRLVEEIASLSLPVRLGHTLLRLASVHGSTANQEMRVGLRLSQKDLGTLVGASREKVNRQLRRWEQQGALVLGRGYLRILKPNLLTADESQAC